MSQLHPPACLPLAITLLVTLFSTSSAELEAADPAQLATAFCISCHGEGFAGGRAPALRGGTWRKAKNDAEAAEIIARGIPGSEMFGFAQAISGSDRQALVTYIRDLASSPQPVAPTADVLSTRQIIQTERQSFRIEQVATGFEVPWSLAFLPDGRILVTERAGSLRIVDNGKNSLPIRGTPHVWYRQDGGLLSLALDPEYEKNGWVYLSYAEPGKQRLTSMTKLVRGRIVDGAWTDQQTVWQADQRYYRTGDDHYGCRLLFHRGKLFFSIGDRGDRMGSQDPGSPFGKIHRIEPDGNIPADNPFVAVPSAYPSVWSYGHRNPQGLAIDPRTGDLWSTEHGPMGGDELNRIEAGKNYGWPLVTFGREHSGAMISEHTSQPGLIDPIRQWTPSIAVCPLYFSTSDQYPNWKDHLLVGSLAFQELRRIELDHHRVSHEELLFKRRGRIRDIVTGPDGLLYLAIEHAGHGGEIVRLVPEN